MLLQVPDAALCYPVLEVGIDTAVGHPLPLGFTIVDESIVCEAAVVGVVVEHLNASLVGRAFECMLRHHRFLAGEASLQVHKGVSGVLVYKYRGVFVPLLREFAF